MHLLWGLPLMFAGVIGFSVLPESIAGAVCCSLAAVGCFTVAGHSLVQTSKWKLTAEGQVVSALRQEHYKVDEPRRDDERSYSSWVTLSYSQHVPPTRRPLLPYRETAPQQSLTPCVSVIQSPTLHAFRPGQRVRVFYEPHRLHGVALEPTKSGALLKAIALVVAVLGFLAGAIYAAAQ